MKTFGMLSVFLFSLLVLGISFDKSAGALTSVSTETEIKMNVEPIITVSFSTRAAILKASMKPGQLDEIKVGAEIRTNSRTGYKAYLSTDKRRKDATDTRATSLVHINNDTDTIPTLESSVTPNNFPVNHWGYSIDGGAHYAGMKASNDIDLADFTTSNSSEARNMDLYFATKVNNDQAGGFYENTIIVTAVANYVAQTINDIEYMQDINNEIALSMEEDHQYQLKDKRDGRKYWVSRLRDGNIWMTQNLDYHNTISYSSSDTRLVLTSALSDVWSDIEYPISYSAYGGTDSYYCSGDCVRTYVNQRYAAGYGPATVLTSAELMSNDEELKHYYLGTKYGENVYKLSALYKQTFETQGFNSEPDPIVDEFDEYVLNHSQSLCPKGWRYPTGREFNYVPYYYGVQKHENWEEVSDFVDGTIYPMLSSTEGSYFTIVFNASSTTSFSLNSGYYYRNTVSNNGGQGVYYDTSSSSWSGAFVRCVMRW